jgi:hypothetical protein
MSPLYDFTLSEERISSKTPSPNGSLRLEIELLLCCARTYIDTATACQIQNLLQKDLDWAYLLQKAFQHGVFLLVYESLQKTHPELIPQNLAHQLRTYSQIKTARNLFLAKELFQIIDLFATHNINTIPFKGPVFGTLAYGNQALREFCDLDILVRKDDFLRAKELLICQGYRHKHFGEHEAAYAQAQLVRNDGKVGIDLHYGITPTDFFFSLDPKPFWQRLQPLSIAGKTVATLSLEDSLLVAYVQGSKENWASLKRICDMAELIRAYPELNWEQIVNQVFLLGREKQFFFSLFLASHHLRTPLPEAISQKIKALPELKFLAEQKYKQLFSDAEWQNLPTRIGGIDLFQLGSIDNLWDRVQYGLRVTLKVNEKDQAMMPLPKFLFFLYYPLRLLRLIKTYKLGKEKIGLLWTFLTK